MPLSDNDLQDVRGRVLRMIMDTVHTFETIEKHADNIFGNRASDIRDAINECLDDFVRNTHRSGEKHPEELIYKAPQAVFQQAGFYGAQLIVKERQVAMANAQLRGSLGWPVRLWRRAFRKWVDIINNFLGSLAAANLLSEALKELKDCMRDELPK